MLVAATCMYMCGVQFFFFFADSSLPSESAPIRAPASLWRCSRIMHLLRDLHPTLLSALEGIVDQVCKLCLVQCWFRGGVVYICLFFVCLFVFFVFFCFFLLFFFFFFHHAANIIIIMQDFYYF